MIVLNCIELYCMNRIFTSDTSYPNAGAQQQPLAQMPGDGGLGWGQDDQHWGARPHLLAMPRCVAQHMLLQ